MIKYLVWSLAVLALMIVGPDVAAQSPTGMVTVSDGVDSCSASVAAGQCTLSLSTTGNRRLTVAYGGDARHAVSNATVGHLVNKAETTTTIVIDEPDSSEPGQAVTVVFTVRVNAPGLGTPTGIVIVSDGIDTCEAAVAAGQCSLTLRTAGSRTLTASYHGDENFLESAGDEAHAVANPLDSTTTTIVSNNPDPSVFGQPVRVIYTVTGSGISLPPPLDLGTIEEIAAAMEPGVWHEIPNTAIEPLLPGPEEIHDARRPGFVIHDWCGAAFDGQRFYAHCGGHKGWYGNGVYAFDLSTLVWESLIEDSFQPQGTAESACPYPLEGPKATHTYGGIVYSESTNSLFRWSGSDYCLNPGLSDPPTFTREHDTWEYLLPFGPWVQHDDPPGTPWFANTAAYDPVTGNIFMSTKREIWIFDPRTKTYVLGLNRNVAVDAGSMVLDTTNRKLVTIDRHNIMVFDVGDGTYVGPRRDPVLTGHVPEDLLVGQAAAMGMAYDSTRDRFLLWNGTRDIYTLKIDYQAMTGRMELYPNAGGPAATISWLSSTNRPRVFTKWHYMPGPDVFVGYNNYQEGVWLYRMPGPEMAAVSPPAPAPVLAGDIRVCHISQMAGWCDYAVLQQAIDAAEPGDTIVIAPGVYKQAANITKEGLTLIGESGAHLKVKVAGGKANLVVKANNVTIEGIECSEVTANSNISCVKNEATGTIIRNVYFHDFDIGINGGPRDSTILIEDSVIGPSAPGHRNHAIYISKWAGEVVLRNSRVICASEGHLFKSGAQRSIVEDSVLAGPDCTESRAFDIVLGGEVVIRGNVIQKSPSAENGDVFGIALEAVAGTAKDFHPVNSTLIADNTIICDRPRCRLVNSNSPAPVQVMNNVIVGADLPDAGAVTYTGNLVFADRAGAGLPAFPGLPR